MKTFPVSPVVADPATVQTLSNLISATPARSAWSRGVRAYALDLVEDLGNRSDFNMHWYGEHLAINEENALNGASDWNHYATGGNGLVYNWSIASRLMTPSELKRYEAGRLNVDLLECEGRALFQAWDLISRVVSNL